MSHFVSCPSCARHVRAASASCPFCEGSLPASPPEPEDAPCGISRAALLALGAAALTAAAGCGGSNVNTVDSGSGNGQQNGKVQMVATDPNGNEQQQQQEQQKQQDWREQRRNTWDGNGVAPPYGSPPLEAV